MVSALESGASSPGLSPGQEHCVHFTLNIVTLVSNEDWLIIYLPLTVTLTDN